MENKHNYPKDVVEEAKKYIFGTEIDWKGLKKFREEHHSEEDLVISIQKLVRQTAEENGVLTDKRKGAFYVVKDTNPFIHGCFYFNDIQQTLKYREQTGQMRKNIAMIID